MEGVTMTLATPEDIIARLGRDLIGTEQLRVQALLNDASAAVVLYTGQQFVEGTSTVTLRVERGYATLGQRPVIAVTTVVDEDGEDVVFTWTAGERVRIDSWVDPVTVTYDHGDAAVPDAIVAVVCNVVLRALGRTPLDSGIQQQSIAGYSETIGPVGASGPVGFLNDERKVLDRYRRPGRVLAGGW